MEISQSIIKQVTSYGLCPKKFKAYEIDRIYENEISINLFRGVYFEYRLLGNLPKNGKVPVYPVGKKGKHEIAKSRIDYHVERFPRIMEENGITVLGGVQNIAWKYSQSITVTLTLDSLLYYKGKVYVGDIKLTPNIHGTFGPFAWGNYEGMDKLQAHLYAYVMSQVLGEEVGFIYMVFDYKPKIQEYGIFEETLTQSKKNEMFDRLIEAERKLRWMNAIGFRPRAYEDTCKTCRIPDCPARLDRKPTPEAEAFVKPEGKTVSVSVDELLNIMNT